MRLKKYIWRMIAKIVITGTSFNIKSTFDIFFHITWIFYQFITTSCFSHFPTKINHSINSSFSVPIIISHSYANIIVFSTKWNTDLKEIEINILVYRHRYVFLQNILRILSIYCIAKGFPHCTFIFQFCQIWHIVLVSSIGPNNGFKTRKSLVRITTTSLVSLICFIIYWSFLRFESFKKISYLESCIS